MMALMHRAEVAKLIDHTLLTPEATAAHVHAACAEGVDLGVGAVCISPRWVGEAAEVVGDSGITVATVVGFPSGAHASGVKAFEAETAVADGAAEIDMVAALGDVLAGHWDRVGRDIAVVRSALPPGVVLKVIIESALLDTEQITKACSVAVEAGAGFVKTSTGFHPAGGATVEAVETMRAAVGPDIGVKASGGIRDAATALAMIEAGAIRIGASSSATILAGFGDGDDPSHEGQTPGPSGR